MKAIKMIGLAALTALTVTAFAGATSAMAETTVLCSVDENPCAEGHKITHLHGTSVGKSIILSSIGNLECNVLALGEVVKTGAPLVISGTSTFTNCALGGSSCTVTEENGPGVGHVLKTGNETSEVTGEVLLHVICGGFIDCSLNGTGIKATGKGPLKSIQVNGEVTETEQQTTKETGGFLCPKTSKADGTVTPLAATYISS